MTPHPLVVQLRFTRSEWHRAFQDVTPEEAVRRFEPMNCISWMIGHLASQEQRYWVIFAQGKTVVPGLDDLVGFGRPASTPPLNEMWDVWYTITREADVYLDTLTPELLQTYQTREGKPISENMGAMLLRNIYHYWYHLGEGQAVRQLLGHTHLPTFVGSMEQAQYTPE